MSENTTPQTEHTVDQAEVTGPVAAAAVVLAAEHIAARATAERPLSEVDLLRADEELTRARRRAIRRFCGELFFLAVLVSALVWVVVAQL